MISSVQNESSRREESLRTAIEVMKAQPGFLGTVRDGTLTAKFITDMAEAFFVYVMGKPSQPAK